MKPHYKNHSKANTGLIPKDYGPLLKALGLSWRGGVENIGFNELTICITDSYTDEWTELKYLLRLTKILGTEDISFKSERRDDGYCESCSSPYSALLIRVRGITKWEMPTEEE